MRLPRLDAFSFPGFGTRKSRNNSTKSSSRAHPVKKAFCGVSIATGWPSCKAARELEGQRFLPREAPQLPLPGCDQGACECAYQHHGDRRDGPRRDAELGVHGIGFRPAEERRDRVDRRTENGAGGGQPPLSYFEHATGAYNLADLDRAGKRLK